MRAPCRLAQLTALPLVACGVLATSAAAATPTVARSPSGKSLVVTALPLVVSTGATCPATAHLTVRGKKSPLSDQREQTPSKTVVVEPAATEDGNCTLTTKVGLPRPMWEGTLVVTIRGKGIHAKRRQLPAA